jgi:hypothetical protein
LRGGGCGSAFACVGGVASSHALPCLALPCLALPCLTRQPARSSRQGTAETRNKTKLNETKPNETKRNETKRNETERNQTHNANLPHERGALRLEVAPPTRNCICIRTRIQVPVPVLLRGTRGAGTRGPVVLAYGPCGHVQDVFVFVFIFVFVFVFVFVSVAREQSACVPTCTLRRAIQCRAQRCNGM